MRTLFVLEGRHLTVLLLCTAVTLLLGKEAFVLNCRLNSVPFRKYAPISSLEQRQSYKNDFNAEYNEYRDLHARIERITRRFTQLDSQLKQLSQGSEEYKVLAKISVKKT